MGSVIQIEFSVMTTELLESAIEVDTPYRDAVLRQVEKLRSKAQPLKDAFASELHEIPSTWLPTCRTPDTLWSVYSDTDSCPPQKLPRFKPPPEFLGWTRLKTGKRARRVPIRRSTVS
jgi:hypothetical protein